MDRARGVKTDLVLIRPVIAQPIFLNAEFFFPIKAGYEPIEPLWRPGEEL